MEGLSNIPEFPQQLEYLWIEYSDIKKGCKDIRLIDIQAYSQLTGVNFNHFEINVILDVDMIRRNST